MSRFSFLLALFCVPFIVGCEGCRRDPNADKDKEEEEQAPRDAFTTGSPDPFPSAGLKEDDARVRSRAVKPGHWLTASVSIKSNNEDSRGELQSRAGFAGVDFQSGRTNKSIETVPASRPIVLPKGQSRRFDYRILPPSTYAGGGGAGQRKNCILSGRYVSTGRAVAVEIPQTPFIAMEPEEYFFLILTNRPERFVKLRKADWVKPFRDQYDFPVNSANYRIVTPPTDDVLPLSETMLDWTNTAVVLWDDAGGDVLTPDQQTALADWVRFGGHLIVNGPDAADAISQGGLVDLLAMKPSGNIELDSDAGEALLRGWQVKTDASVAQQIGVLKAQSGRVAIDGEVAQDAVAIPDTGKLVLRRPVGRGLVVQPRFDVTSDWLMDWKSFDSFFNNAILSRGHRRFAAAESDGPVRLIDVRTQSALADAAMNTRLRIASRDAALIARPANGKAAATSQSQTTLAGDLVSGIGGWNDSSDIVSAGREILRRESGIEIPKSSLVVRSLGYYLLILVPINFLVFRLMGRLEYAWLAVPAIAIIGAIWVARAARLDIGFARSQTEIALLELHADYPRGHLTRIDAIYNSLSSTYEVQFKTADGCAMPMQSSQTAIDYGEPIFKTSYEEGPSLSGLAVGSNQVRFVHAEQMIDVGGAISVDANEQLVNRSTLEIVDAFVIDQSDPNRVRVAAVGTVAPESSLGLRFRDTGNVAVSDELPMQTGELIRRIAQSQMMEPGSIKLIGRIDGPMDGMTIMPQANQILAQTVVLCHLTHSPPPQNQPDVNLRTDIANQSTPNGSFEKP